MSDPKRYYLYAGLECHAFSKVEAVLKFSEEDDGMWVKYEDYACLKAEVERLTAEKDQAECDYDNCQRRKVSIDNHRCDLFMENKTLKAEIEGLYRNGDLMLKFAAANMPYPAYATMAKDWLAVKEGKPSV